MPTSKRKALVDNAEALLATIRSSVLVHAQDGVHPRHLRSPLDSARSLNACVAKLDDVNVATATDALEAWLMLLAAETDEISHTRTRSLLDQISEVEVALIAFKARSGPSMLDVSDFVDHSFDSLQAVRYPEPDPEPVVPEDFEIDAEMLEVFREEASALLQNIQTNLDLLLAKPDDRSALWEIKRNAHTLKGAAGIVGFKRASELAHRIEDLLDQLSHRGANSNGDTFGLLRDAAECLRALSSGEKSSRLDSQIASLYRQFARASRVIEETVEGQVVPHSTNPSENAEKGGIDHASKPTRNLSIVRISLDRLDELVRNVRELVVSKVAFEQHIAELRHQLDESSNNTLRLQAATGKIEGFDHDPLAPEAKRYRSVDFLQNTYELSETARDASVIDSGFGIVKDRFEALYERQRLLIKELQERLLRLRNVEFGTIATRLQRTVRVTCDEEGKSAELVIENSSLEIDTQLIDALIEPLMHLLKNAVVHGIESAETRRLLGKAESGKITVSINQDETTILLAVADDGRGIAFQPLIEKAMASKMITSPEADVMDGERLHELLFLPGLTTAEKLNLNAGRGVGMSIVRECVAAVGGRISIETWPQRGTTFLIKLPRPFADGKVPEKVTTLPAAQLPRSDMSVLIVDDSPSVRMMMSRMVQKQGWRAETAKNGIDALAKLAAMSVLPNVILSDIEMPMMGGYEFIAAVRDDASLKHIPVIFISSRKGDREQALAAGAAEYLTKPYDECRLTSLVDALTLAEELAASDQ